MSWVPKQRVPKLLTGLTTKVSSNAADEGIVDAGGSGVPFTQTMYLYYRDAKGDESKRRVTTRCLRPWGGGDDLAMIAWCHERDALRTFLASRMQELVDLNTGESHRPPAPWLWQQYRSWPDHEQFEAEPAAATERPAEPQVLPAIASPANRLRLARRAVLCMVYVARSDGRMDMTERGVIAKFLRNAERNLGVEFPWSDVHGQLQRLSCDQGEFLVGIKQLRSGPAEFRTLLRNAVTELVAADGNADPEEQRASRWLEVMMA
ncbi:MAG TPA: WYL domain-containing protein [Nevskiaceae bacterium]|nr:WYL domain-containing protein [Nevskiaceae bacterium]